jgi:hypothetical protein
LVGTPSDPNVSAVHESVNSNSILDVDNIGIIELWLYPMD